MQILEKQFEDWVCANIEQVVCHGARVVGRQITLPHGGILDVLAAHECDAYGHRDFDTAFTVIEIKRELADSSALFQLLGYMGALRDALHCGWKDIMDLPGYEDTPQGYELRGILAAPEIAKDVALAIHGLGQIDYVGLGVQISASKWGTRTPNLIDADAAEDLGVRISEEMSISRLHWGKRCNALRDIIWPESNGSSPETPTETPR